MITGIACAIAACMLWGLAFAIPVSLPDYPGLLLAFGRYLSYGLIALLPALIEFKALTQLRRRDWLAALRLGLIGNLIYYACLATAIQLAGAPFPTLLIGTLPAVISVCANLTETDSGLKVRWRNLIVPLILILTGLTLVNHAEIVHLISHQPGEHAGLLRYLCGCAFALVALAAWTWYPIRNARYLRRHPHIRVTIWTSAQGLATLPLMLPGFFLYAAWLGGHALSADNVLFAFPFGPRPVRFLVWMFIAGLFVSWMGTLLWSYASKRLPTPLLSQLIVFETLTALLYTFILQRQIPTPLVMLGIVLLCMGVLAAVRAFRSTAQTASIPPAANL